MLIGLSGLKGSGKDTTADIMKIIANCDTISFAKPIKDISKDLFNWTEEDVNGKFKEKKRICKINNWKVRVNAVCKSHVHEFRSFDDNKFLMVFLNKVILKDKSFKTLLIPWCKLNKDLKVNISPRKFMQLFGTDLARTIDKKIWINHLVNNYNNNDLIVTDVRFNNEAKAIKKLGGTIIKINRNLNNKDTHKSEKGVNKEFIDFTIDNNGTKEELIDSVKLAMDVMLCQKTFS